MLKLRMRYVAVGLFLTQVMMMHLLNINLRKDTAKNMLNITGRVNGRGFGIGGDGARDIGC